MHAGGPSQSSVGGTARKPRHIRRKFKARSQSTVHQESDDTDEEIPSSMDFDIDADVEDDEATGSKGDSAAAASPSSASEDGESVAESDPEGSDGSDSDGSDSDGSVSDGSDSEFGVDEGQNAGSVPRSTEQSSDNAQSLNKLKVRLQAAPPR